MILKYRGNVIQLLKKLDINCRKSIILIYTYYYLIGGEKFEKVFKYNYENIINVVNYNDTFC